ncbi:GM11649 [Drosophila sechellia]|uniref:GM11649 n=1 Tax=Drosophila sechellia TaxID=7238 RepID=B4IM53_DROSE|nr:GM11649 [Drosophila sechellia]
MLSYLDYKKTFDLTTDASGIHSVIKRRPADIVLTHLDEPQVDFHNMIQKAKTALRAMENDSRQNRVFEVGGKVLVIQAKTRQ